MGIYNLYKTHRTFLQNQSLKFKTLKMSETDYVRLIVDSVELNSNAYEDNYAVSKSYVDGVKSEIMGGLAPEALDTIKELAEYMADSTVAGGLVTQITAVSTSVSDESSRAMAAESVLSAQISSVDNNLGALLSAEVSRASAAESGINSQLSFVENNLNLLVTAETTRAGSAEAGLSSQISSVETGLAAEVTRATDAETALGSQISSVETGLETSLTLKADKAGAAFSGDVTLDSYLQFGALWRVKGSADGKRLVFEYKRNDVWRTALPFITSA